MASFRIAELAREGGVHLETIRYYEREGLMPPPQRTPSGHRSYTPADARRLQFIKRAQALGFTLHEVGELLALKVEPDQPCTGVVHQIEAKQRDVQARIAQLQAIERTLDQMKASCEGRCAVSECPILESLDGGVPA